MGTVTYQQTQVLPVQLRTGQGFYTVSLGAVYRGNGKRHIPCGEFIGYLPPHINPNLPEVDTGRGEGIVKKGDIRNKLTPGCIDGSQLVFRPHKKDGKGKVRVTAPILESDLLV